jgi:dihydrofolate synthase/folylpolyglutamate synthase
MTYLEALSYLGETRRFGMKPGLEPMRELARALGDPQNQLRFIHLAGTNGKGSTAAFCESCLREAGFRGGLYTSPHLVSIRERIQINRDFISEADFAEGIGVVRRAIERMQHQSITFFEIMTALALWYFAREKVEWVVWETGLGGRLDATNIVTPEVCIITNIGLDHQQYLGETLREIAAEKAGIIKPGVPVVTAVDLGEAAEVIRERAKLLGAKLTFVRGGEKVENGGLRGLKQIGRIDGRDFALGLIGPHQIDNAACALEALRPFHLADDAIARGLEKTVWPGRFQILSETPLIVLDGAHNPAGTRMLVETWRAFLTARFGWSAEETESRAHLVFASVADKDISEMASLLRPLARRVSLVRLANERSADPQILAQAFPGLPCVCYNSVTEAWQNLAVTHPEQVTLVTGSLFLVGEMLARGEGNAGEYRLNERLEKITSGR